MKSNIIRQWDNLCAEASTPEYKCKMSGMRNFKTGKKRDVTIRQFLLDTH